MSLHVCLRHRALVVVAAFLPVLSISAAASAQSAPATFKVAWFNIQSGKGEPAMTGHVGHFTDTSNCTDPALPLNGWGVGFVQKHLLDSVGSDPKIVALGLAEAWTCGSPENVRKLLGWKANSGNQNGVAMVAKYGFAGPEEWVELDTSLNVNPVDTMWVLRVPVCLDALCSKSMNMFSSHWYSSGTNKIASYNRQAQQTVAFLKRAGGTAPHILIGDLNVWDGTVKVCTENPPNAGLQYLRDAGYVDGWLLLQGSAEGYTGMTNRSGCGNPVGYGWKRPDYTWSPANYTPVSIKRFGIVPGGDEAPSDHYGLITEFPTPGVVPPTDAPPSVTLLTPAEGATVTGGAMKISASATDDIGVTRVEILEDGVVKHTLTTAPYEVSSSLASIDGAHTVAARAYDGTGHVTTSGVRHIVVETPSSGGPILSPTGEVVVYAKNAKVVAGNWRVVADPSAAGGSRMWNPDAAAAKLPAALAAPASYFELTFDAVAGRGYRLWMRARADTNAWTNDSVYVQFSGAVTSTGAPVARTGTVDAMWVSLEDCSGCGLSGWGWQDNGYGTLGPLVYFAQTGPQTIRVQQREDGISIDQIVLSPEVYLTNPPGAPKLDATVLPLTAPAAPPTTLSATEIVLGSGAVSAMSGTWKVIADATAANGAAFGNPDAGAAKPALALAAPANYVELTFRAEAGKSYRLWLRGRAEKDSWANDSVFVQFSGSLDPAGRAVARIASTDSYTVNLEDAASAGVAGWGWQDNGYGAGVLGPLVKFETTGTQTVRIQTREDGLRIDQVVLSSATYLTAAPGALKNDTTIVR